MRWIELVQRTLPVAPYHRFRLRLASLIEARFACARGSVTGFRRERDAANLCN